MICTVIVTIINNDNDIDNNDGYNNDNHKNVTIIILLIMKIPLDTCFNRSSSSLSIVLIIITI